MPRIEVIPSPLHHDDATPSIDCCKSCAGRLDGRSVPQRIIYDVAKQGFSKAESFRFGSMDVEHPPYDNEYIECTMCGEKLTNVDD